MSYHAATLQRALDGHRAWLAEQYQVQATLTYIGAPSLKQALADLDQRMTGQQ